LASSVASALRACACAGMAPKRSLLQSAFVKAEAKKQPRARSHKSVTLQAAKALGDYIKSFSEQEIDSTVIDGLSLRARLTKDKAKNAAKLGSVTMGRTYYNGLRAMFSCMCLSPQAYKNSRVVEEDPKAFFENFQDIWPLVLPLDETKVVMSLKGGQSFNGCHVELNKVCTSVALGMACSAFALHIIMGDVAQNTIADYVAKVMKTKQITQEVIRKRRADAIGKCQGLPNITCLPAKRSVVFAYGAFSVALEFSCVQEQLVPLKVVVSSDAVTGAKAARAWAQSLLTVIEKPGAGKMQAQLASAQVKFQSIGPTWEIETGFLQTMIDGTGASNLEEDFLSHLSTKGGGPDLASATVNGTILVGSKLAQFASAGCVGAVKAAISICVTMQSGQAPKIPGNSTHFMQSVFSRLGFYATY